MPNWIQNSLGQTGYPAVQSKHGLGVHELPLTWWLIAPLGFFCMRYAVARIEHRFTGLESWFLGELGIVENLTVAFLLLALISTLAVLRLYGRHMHIVPRIFLAIYCLGCLYFAGEEASWGQHWFGWETGEYFQAVNDQRETNLHNTSVWFDRLPKGIVSLWIFVGGIVVPLCFYCKSLKIDCSKPGWWLWPTWVCLPTAIFATIATWPSKIERYTGWNFYFDEAQEIKELYIAYFILLYIVSLALRLQKMQQSDERYSPL